MEQKVYPALKNSLLLCLLLLGMMTVLGLIGGVLGGLFNLSTGIFLIAGNLVSFGVVLLIGFKKTKRSFAAVFKLNNVSASLWIAIIIFMVGFVIVSSELDNIVNYILPMPEMFRSVFDSLLIEQAFIAAIIIVGIIPGFLEEFFFRGLILDGLSRNYSQRKAIIVSALLFGIIHLNPWQFYSAFIIGVISAFICIKINSIVLSIYIHLFNNIVYTTTVKYRHIIPIKGFNTNFALPVEFQPLWFDIAGLIVLAIGILLLKKSMCKNNSV